MRERYAAALVGSVLGLLCVRAWLSDSSGWQAFQIQTANKTAAPAHDPKHSALSASPHCTHSVEAVIGLWIIKGNAKHRPGFFLKRLATVARAVAAQMWNLTLITDSDAAVTSASDAYQRHGSGLRLNVRRVALDALPYQAQALKVDAACPTKYGKQIPAGSLQTLDKVWLSKVWALASTAASAQGASAPACPSSSWAWFDAGLNADEIRRALKSIRANKSLPNSSEIRLQFYPEGMRKAPTAYFRGRCPVQHTLNAKVIWATVAGIERLLASFNECLGKLVQDANCTCWDEETVLAHIHQKVAPCDTLGSPAPVFTHIDVYDTNKRIK
jgi:hypothetical protein